MAFAVQAACNAFITHPHEQYDRHLFLTAFTTQRYAAISGPQVPSCFESSPGSVKACESQGRKEISLSRCLHTCGNAIRSPRRALPGSCSCRRALTASIGRVRLWKLLGCKAFGTGMSRPWCRKSAVKRYSQKRGCNMFLRNP